MFFKKFDVISPPITLYFRGNNIHSSIFSGVLTIIVYVLIFTFGVYYALEFINKENPTAFFFNRYIEDSGQFPLNASSMFHFIQFQDNFGDDLEPIDFDIIRIVGVQNISIENYLSTNLENIHHWLYGLCNNDTDTANIRYLITLQTYSHCSCIRKYYNPNTKEYYDTNSTNFVWPSIEHGMSNDHFFYYGLIVEKCKEDNLRKKSGLKSCRSNDEINSYIYSKLIYVYFVDHYSDVLNYNYPFTKYLYSVSNMFFPNSYTVNNLNFNPAMTKTHNGIFFDNIIEELSYFFLQNEKVTMDDGSLVYDEDGNQIMKSTGIVSSYYFYLQNRLQIYERNYKKLQDTLSDIGGLSRVVLICAIVINTLVSDYIILLDTEKLVLSLDADEKLNQYQIGPNHFYKMNLMINPGKKIYYPNNHNNNDYLQSSNLQGLREDISINHNHFIKTNNFINNDFYKKKEEESKCKVNETQLRKKKNNNYKGVNEEGVKNNIINDKESLNVFFTDEKERNINRPLQKQNFNWFKYIKYIIFCYRNNPSISYYEKYRAKIISEESIIKDHLNILKLININLVQRKNLKENNLKKEL